jgi:hypothetical protein
MEEWARRFELLTSADVHEVLSPARGVMGLVIDNPIAAYYPARLLPCRPDVCGEEEHIRRTPPVDAVRIFADPPPKTRERKRLIHRVDPEVRRKLGKAISQLPQYVSGPILTMAKEDGVSAESIVCYSLALSLFAKPIGEQLAIIRETCPDACDAEIERGLAEFKRALDAEMEYNRKSMA